MQTRDHLVLGYFLLDFAGSEELSAHRRAFLAGCVEPDCNAATYLRGMRAGQKFRGHHAENSFAHLSKEMAEIEAEGLCTPWDYFALGTMLHYAADAFTWPHNTFWPDSLARHVVYEQKLHAVFAGELARGPAGTEAAQPRALAAFFAESHRAYSNEPRGMETDCRYIIGVCEGLLRGSLRCAVPVTESPQCWKEAAAYAHTYHGGLV